MFPCQGVEGGGCQHYPWLRITVLLSILMSAECFSKSSSRTHLYILPSIEAATIFISQAQKLKHREVKCHLEVTHLSRAELGQKTGVRHHVCTLHLYFLYLGSSQHPPCWAVVDIQWLNDYIGNHCWSCCCHYQEHGLYILQGRFYPMKLRAPATASPPACASGEGRRQKPVGFPFPSANSHFRSVRPLHFCHCLIQRFREIKGNSILKNREWLDIDSVVPKFGCTW